MKNRIVSLITVLIFSIMSFVSCNSLWGSVGDQGDITVVVAAADGSYEVYKTYLESVENKNEGAKGIIAPLRDREDNPLYLEMVDSTYGAYVSAIGSIKENTADKMYVIVYTTVRADSYEGAPTTIYEGRTLYQAGLGLSGMSVEAGTVILFKVEKSPY